MFVQFYATVVVCGVVAAVVCPRIPPLSWKKDTYYGPVGKQINEEVPDGISTLQWGFQKAVEKAEGVKSYKSVVKSGVQNVIDIWFSLIPLVMALGTIALMIAEFTPIFDYLSYPFVPLLQVLQIPEAQAAGSGHARRICRYVLTSCCRKWNRIRIDPFCHRSHVVITTHLHVRNWYFVD